MDILALQAAKHPDKPALIQDERLWTWGDYVACRNRVAHGLLDLGITPGQHVIIYTQNSIEHMLAAAAARAVGAIPAPMNHRLVAEEVAYILDHSDATAVFVGDPFIPIVEAVRAGASKVRHWILVGAERRPWARHLDDLLAAARPEPVAVEAGAAFLSSIIYTGGTTGKPKGALRRSLDVQALLGTLAAMDLTDPNHIHLVAGPMYHSAPGGFAAYAHLVGATVIVMGKFEPEQALGLTERHRCSSTFMAPTLLHMAAAPCPTRVKEAVLAYFGSVLYEFYGSSELGVNTILLPDEVLTKPGSCGRAAPGRELALLDDDGRPVPVGEPGELYVRRFPGMLDEYYKDPAATEAMRRGEWCSVGDVAYVDADGFYYICDRKRDMIISAGVNIYPAEVEDALHRLPGIQDVAVFGVPDDDWGERVHAAVQLQSGAQLTAEAITTFARQHLADYKVPRDASGKLLKRVLREPHWAGRAARI